MNGANLVDALARDKGLSKVWGKKIVGVFFDQVAEESATGDRVDI